MPKEIDVIFVNVVIVLPGLQVLLFSQCCKWFCILKFYLRSTEIQNIKNTFKDHTGKVKQANSKIFSCHCNSGWHVYAVITGTMFPSF